MDKFITLSVPRLADTNDSNLRAELLCWEDNRAPILHSRQDGDTICSAIQPTTSLKDHLTTTPLIDTEDFLGRSILLDKQEYSQRFRDRIIKLIEDNSSDYLDNKTTMKFLLIVNNDKSKYVIAYNQLLE
jgi:hypothetical protein